jgi:hypothetical protein
VKKKDLRNRESCFLYETFDFDSRSSRDQKYFCIFIDRSMNLLKAQKSSKNSKIILISKSSSEKYFQTMQKITEKNQLN